MSTAISSFLQKTRTRFAPSPTGALHIGGLRTALYNYIVAKLLKGTFVLRIEDTDQKRWVPKSEEYIMECLEWLGISPDEGPVQGGEYGPYRQSERKHIYAQYALELVKKKQAYYAFDTVEELEVMRARQVALGVHSPKYNAITRMAMKNAFTLSEEEVQRRISTNKPYVIRLLVNHRATIKFKDQVRGWVQVQGAEVDDKVLLKEDGMPTYHLANVVDDHLMKITHVIRGEEWLPSTPAHVLLYQALGWEMPIFAHLPLLLNPDGKGKLSKRSATEGCIPLFPLNWYDAATDTTVVGLREAGYLPEALTNFLALLGWHPSGNEELLSLAVLCKTFSLARINKGGVRFDLGKAKWFNQQYLKALPDELLAKRYLMPKLEEAKIDTTLSYASSVCAIVKERLFFPTDIWDHHHYFFLAPTTYPLDVVAKVWTTRVTVLFLDLARRFGEIAVCKVEDIRTLVQEVAENHDIKLGKIMLLMRIALTGVNVGPELWQIMTCLGAKNIHDRLQAACVAWRNNKATLEELPV